MLRKKKKTWKVTGLKVLEKYVSKALSLVEINIFYKRKGEAVTGKDKNSDY